MKKVLVLGRTNGGLSQMMAALLTNNTFNRIEVHSAGITPAEMNKSVIKVLKEIGIDITSYRPKSFKEFIHTKFDIIITTTAEARAALDNFYGNFTKIHKEFDDPRKNATNEFELENAYRELRDQMNDWLTEFVNRHRLT